MGRASRPKTKYLGVKLRKIREELGLNYDEMIQKLNCPQIALYPASVYEYEKGRREPPLQIILNYARLANLYVDVLIDDQLEIPNDFLTQLKTNI